uniref:Lysophosphatidic acid receptor 2b n=1 Tax=Neogobius melanostomus TaxID=47308 RepID=A0A8C6S407_9GOBI
MDIIGEDKAGCFLNRSVKFFYTESGKNISEEWRKRDYVVVTLGVTVCFIVIFSNLLVILAILKNRRFHFPIYYLLCNLALSDLFSGVSYLHLMFHTGPWTINLNKSQWFVRQGLIDTSLTASVLNLLAVAVERHQTIFSMQVHSEMSSRRVLIIIVAIWLVAIFMGLVPTMGWHCLCDLPNCSTMAPMYKRSYLVFWAVLNLLTFSIMLAVYTRIFLYVRHKSKQMSQHTSQKRYKETVVNLMKTVSLILEAQVQWSGGGARQRAPGQLRRGPAGALAQLELTGGKDVSPRHFEPQRTVQRQFCRVQLKPNVLSNADLGSCVQCSFHRLKYFVRILIKVISLLTKTKSKVVYETKTMTEMSRYFCRLKSD